MVRWGIYAWVHVPTGRTYVGQTGPTHGFTERRKDHLLSLRKGAHHSRYFQRAWNKYGESEFKFVVLEDTTGDDTDQLTLREQFWMDNTDSAFNGRPAAGSMLGFRHSPETRVRIGDRSRGVSKSPEYRAKISASEQGKTVSAETRAKLRESHLGKKPSPEAIAKTAAANRGRIPWNKGGTNSAETRAKISAANRGRPGRPHTLESRAKMSEAAKLRESIAPRRRINGSFA